ncbi:Tetratricopeptide repeat protein 1 [Echinococcus granulosus]|uniref:Tetratricopeptide repeat protein n=1 Tax=Echinococcus granulosus TaxID=6210 RepID=U6JGH1_ECHGR|nr:Tetratricopeptide repeat protein [Echinococcus granulosus]EUB59233.1 Tetratricopeptide repeat protein [Echinococcus granulosus]KAH9284621.1 Tetratricopeptide repeat protein 1 [Echinococcus granulosus]CDS23208.1 Tetratricopeptide repeat protein 1 [Echinococcus granulosus]
MAETAGDMQNDPLLDVIDEKANDIEDLSEHFYDTCSLDSPNKIGEPKFSDSHDDPMDFHDPKSEHDGEDILQARLEEENLLSTEELERRKLKAIDLKEDGNSKFRENLFEDALSLYTTALDTCPLRFSDERAKIYSNRALCHSHLGSPKAALTDCDEALKLNPDYLRCLIRRADLRESADRLTEALEDYQHVLQLDPSNAKARAACAILPEKINAQQEKLKAEMFSQLKQLGNLVLRPFGLSTDNFKLTKDPNSGGYSVSFQQST